MDIYICSTGINKPVGERYMPILDYGHFCEGKKWK